MEVTGTERTGRGEEKGGRRGRRRWAWVRRKKKEIERREREKESEMRKKEREGESENKDERERGIERTEREKREREGREKNGKRKRGEKEREREKERRKRERVVEKSKREGGDRGKQLNRLRDERRQKVLDSELTTTEANKSPKRQKWAKVDGPVWAKCQWAKLELTHVRRQAGGRVQSEKSEFSSDSDVIKTLQTQKSVERTLLWRLRPRAAWTFCSEAAGSHKHDTNTAQSEQKRVPGEKSNKHTEEYNCLLTHSRTGFLTLEEKTRTVFYGHARLSRLCVTFKPLLLSRTCFSAFRSFTSDSSTPPEPRCACAEPARFECRHEHHIPSASVVWYPALAHAHTAAAHCHGERTVPRQTQQDARATGLVPAQPTLLFTHDNHASTVRHPGIRWCPTTPKPTRNSRAGEGVLGVTSTRLERMTRN
ncbi:hypothetical protein WMY93_027241 [Mugilogobius chulae]|uniref:Uncharacterized protein n=1 Tax=Mugilogobius chulae TaxID=88201 RepID=A0AAW0N2K5_9GOBI